VLSGLEHLALLSLYLLYARRGDSYLPRHPYLDLSVCPAHELVYPALALSLPPLLVAHGHSASITRRATRLTDPRLYSSVKHLTHAHICRTQIGI
jgi:hypothetical protein